MAYRLNAVVEDGHGFRDFVGNRTTFLAPSFQFKLAPQTTLDIDAEFLKRDSNFDRGFPLALNVPVLTLPAQRFLGDPSDTFKNSSNSFSVMLNHTLASGTKLRFGLSQNRAQSDGNYFFPTGTTPLVSNAGVLSRRNQLTSDINRDTVYTAEATEFELGVRQDFLDKRVQTSATLFDITRTNVRVADAVMTTQDRQVGAQRARGIELELSGRPTARWQVVASLSSLDAKITQDTAALTGKRFQGAPTSSAALWNRYDFSPALGLGAGLVYAGERFVDPTNTMNLPAYTRWDLAAYGQITKSTRWQINLLNALNTAYFENGNTVNKLYPGQPRAVRASMNVKF